MLSIIYALVFILNLTFLSFAVLELGPLFIFYFSASQGVVAWLLFDHIKAIKAQAHNSRELSGQMKNPLQASDVDSASDSTTMPPIQFESTENLSFQPAETEVPSAEPKDIIVQTFESAPSTQKYYFLKKTFDDRNTSQLEMLDQLLVKIPKQKRSLVVTNLHTTTKNSKNFEGFLWGKGLESEIICSDIHSGIDLIPHLGSLHNCPEGPTADYFAAKALDYDQIVFYLIETELSTIENILFAEPDDIEISNFQQIQL